MKTLIDILNKILWAETGLLETEACFFIKNEGSVEKAYFAKTISETKTLIFEVDENSIGFYLSLCEDNPFIPDDMREQDIADDMADERYENSKF